MNEWRYFVFTDDARLSMVEAWPGIKDFQPGAVWALRYAQREEPDFIWGPPSEGKFEGSYEELERLMAVGGWTNVEKVA